jgi:GTPase SAR1 family protein
MLAYKVVLFGTNSVGKSSILVRLVHNKFHKNIDATIGASFFCHNLKRPTPEGDRYVQLRLWDTAGSERFSSLLPMYVRGAACVLICFTLPRHFDVQSSTNEFRSASRKDPETTSREFRRDPETTSRGEPDYLFQIMKYVDEAKRIEPDILVYLVATKVDDPSSCDIDREYDKVRQYAKAQNYPLWYTSSLHNINITQLFEHISDTLLKTPKVLEFVEQDYKKGTITLAKPDGTRCCNIS